MEWLAEIDWQSLGMSGLFVITYILFLKRQVTMDNEILTRIMKSIDVIIRVAEKTTEEQEETRETVKDNKEKIARLLEELKK